MRTGEQVLAELMADPRPADPYPLYAELRAEHPVVESGGVLYLSRYGDCEQALRSPGLVVAVGDLIAKQDPRYASSAWLRSAVDMIIFSNGDRHRRLRRALQRAFTVRMVDRLRPAVREMVDETIDRILARGPEFDLVADLAAPIPCRVISELLGVDRADHHLVEHWAEIIGQVSAPVVTDEVLARVDAAVEELHDHVRRIVEARRAEPRDDLMSALIAVEDEDGPLTDGELLSYALSLLVAGSDTTRHLVVVGTLALAANPAELAKLQADPGLLTGAIDELLRFEAPVQMGWLRAVETGVEIAGRPVEPGQLVSALIGSANHDDAAFPDGDRLWIDRVPDRPHLSFGHGPHFCMGAALARLEASTVFRALLLERCPRLRIVDDTRSWYEAFMIRGLHSLRVAAK